MMMRSSYVLIFFFISTSLVAIGLVSSDPLQDKCSPEFTKLGECLNYATAKADAPTSACCGSVGEIRNKDAVCLCYIIQQAHSGGSTFTSLGVQLDRLIKLPSACKLSNTDITDCPKLLNLSPSSPDYAIFSNSTKATTTPSTPSASSTTSSTPTSEGIRNNIRFSGIFTTAIAFVACLFAFQVEA